MPILLVFALTAACLPVRWPAPLGGGGPGLAVGLTTAAVLAAWAAAFTLRSWVVRTLRREPFRRAEVATVYVRLRRLLFFANLGLVALCLLVFGWGWFAWQTFVIPDPSDNGRSVLAPFAELTVPLPYFLILFGTWVIYYDAERALHAGSVYALRPQPFWTRTGYVLNHLRQFALLVMLPVMLFVTQQTLTRLAPETTQTDAYRLGSLAVIPLLILFLPLLVKPLLGLRPLPAGPVRDRLEALARRLHFRYNDLLLWPTHGAVANALIVGLLPPVRYVIFTDRILEELTPEELDAVLGHEIGHAKHGHIWFYGAFLALSIGVLAALLVYLGQQLDAYARATGYELPAWVEDWLPLPPVLVTAGYVFFVFGYLSRRCERQADVYGCRAVSCADPHCSGHDDRTVYPERAAGLCPTGIRTFVRALRRVAEINGQVGAEDGRPSVRSLWRGLLGWLRAWQHATLPRRVGFLQGLIENPGRERQFQLAVDLLKWGLLTGLLGALVALGQAVGWRQLLELL